MSYFDSQLQNSICVFEIALNKTKQIEVTSKTQHCIKRVVSMCQWNSLCHVLSPPSYSCPIPAGIIGTFIYLLWWMQSTKCGVLFISIAIKMPKAVVKGRANTNSNRVISKVVVISTRKYIYSFKNMT